MQSLWDCMDRKQIRNTSELNFQLPVYIEVNWIIECTFKTVYSIERTIAANDGHFPVTHSISQTQATLQMRSLRRTHGQKKMYCQQRMILFINKRMYHIYVFVTVYFLNYWVLSMF